MAMVRLKNGAVEPKSIVQMTMQWLNSLRHSYPVHFYELVLKCRDSTLEFKELSDLGIVLSDGSVDESVRNVVLSAAEGEGTAVTGFGSPIADRLVKLAQSPQAFHR